MKPHNFHEDINNEGFCELCDKPADHLIHLENIEKEEEEMVRKCIEIMRQEQKASTSFFQRRLRLGYTRAKRILDIVEARGLVGPGEGAQPRQILTPETQ